jgi:hypothetical protein
MDIARPDLAKKRRRRMIIIGAVVVVVVAAALFAAYRLKPAAPTVDGSAVWPDTVKRGPMIRQVRGSTGSLVPREDSIELIPAQTDATVVRIRVLPGTKRLRSNRRRHLRDHPGRESKQQHRHQGWEDLSNGLIGGVAIHRRDPVVRDRLEYTQHEVNQHQAHAGTYS